MVPDGCSTAQVEVAFAIKLEEVLVVEVLDELDGLTCGFHLRAKFLVDVGELVK